MYNYVLKVSVISTATMVGYSGGIDVIIIGKHLADVELYSSEVNTAKKNWLKDASPALAEYLNDCLDPNREPLRNQQ